MSDLLDGALRGFEKRECEEHIHTCRECASLLARLKGVRDQLRSLPHIRTSADFDAMLRARIRLSSGIGRGKHHAGRRAYVSWRVPAFAAGIIAFVIIGVMVAGMLGNQKTQNLARIAEQNSNTWSQQSTARPIPRSDDEVQINYVLDRIPLDYLLLGEGVPLSSEGMQRVRNSRADSLRREITGGDSPAGKAIYDKRQVSF